VLDKAFDFFDHYFPQKEDWPENHTHGTTRELKLGEHKLVPGEYAVRFECVGANPMSRHPRTGEFGKGYGLRLDSMSFRRLPIEDAHEWIQEYLKREEVLFAGFVREAKETVERLDAAIRAFERDRGRYPKTLDELVGTPYWKGQRIPLDPWHQPYRYRCPGVVRPWDFDVYSVHGDSKYPASWFGNWENPLSIPGGINAIAHEGENLKVKQASPGVRASRLRHMPEGIAPLSGERMLFLPFGKPGDAAEIELPADIPNGRYKVYVFTPTSWDFGVCQWSLNGVSLGEPFDAETPTRGMKSLPAAVVELKPGPRILRVEAVGKSKYSTGYKAGLDAIVLAPLR
ncbi:MAG: hypothetical protein GX621_16240, partial [Pirellulaceae bacterium]|nr:hypothetical protein [Pirellulaceae bacterium]